MLRLLLAVFVLVSSTSCKDCKGVAPVAHVVEDCINDNRGDITALIVKWATGKSLDDVLLEAVAAGLHVGGCALHEWVNTKLTPTDGNHALPADQAEALRGLVTKFRAELKVDPKTVFRTSKGSIGAN